MRTLCDSCESAAAIVFCAADEAALCRACDEKVHLCNKLASRHVRVGLATPSAVPCCDICENAPAFFYCEIDGSSLCLQCDMVVHVGGKRTHGRYLVLRQRVEFPGDKPGNIVEDPPSQPIDPGEARKVQHQQPRMTIGENHQNHRASPIRLSDASDDGHVKMDNKLIDLNMKPNRMHGQASNKESKPVRCFMSSSTSQKRVSPKVIHTEAQPNNEKGFSAKMTVPSYIVSCHNCGHGTDLRGCPQVPLSPEGDAQNCSNPDAVHKVRQQIVEHIDLWLSECQDTDV